MNLALSGILPDRIDFGFHVHISPAQSIKKRSLATGNSDLKAPALSRE
jgi:hypothetical protein